MLAALNWWRTARSHRLREQGLCQRCGLRPGTVTKSDFIVEIEVCEKCALAVGSFGGMSAPRVAVALAGIAGAGLAATLCMLLPVCSASGSYLLTAVVVGMVGGALAYRSG